MWRRRSDEPFARRGSCANALPRIALGFLPFSMRLRPGIHEFPMGLSSFGSGLSSHLPRPVTSASIRSNPTTHIALRAFSPLLAPVSPHVDVWGRQIDQRRRILVESYSAPL